MQQRISSPERSSRHAAGLVRSRYYLAPWKRQQAHCGSFLHAVYATLTRAQSAGARYRYFVCLLSFCHRTLESVRVCRANRWQFTKSLLSILPGGTACAVFALCGFCLCDAPTCMRLSSGGADASTAEFAAQNRYSQLRHGADACWLQVDNVRLRCVNFQGQRRSGANLRYRTNTAMANTRVS